ncbi:MAG: transposase [Anaerolineales bacterium]|nr:transposase [Anaerolineales bacterium]
MSSWKPNFDPNHLYFVTTKAVDYLHLFQRDAFKRLILDAFDCFRLRGRMKLYAFVIMPNHIHFMGQFRQEDPLAAVVRDFKKHTSDRILRQLKAEGDLKRLEALAAKVGRPEKQKYKVWEDDYNAKEVFSAEFLEQKMNYIHSNPCQDHWKLSAAPEEYLWSSARFYFTEEPCIIPIDDVRDILA